ncbi:MAG TPA: hypothetical protein VGO59_09995 [Verrucomicrobiae bacterium]|jgi:hypothetical protein
MARRGHTLSGRRGTSPAGKSQQNKVEQGSTSHFLEKTLIGTAGRRETHFHSESADRSPQAKSRQNKPAQAISPLQIFAILSFCGLIHSRRCGAPPSRSQKDWELSPESRLNAAKCGYSRRFRIKNEQMNNHVLFFFLLMPH